MAVNKTKPLARIVRDKYIAVREKNKPWVMKKNPNYKELKDDNREKNKIRG